MGVIKKVKESFIFLREINERIKKIQQALGRIEHKQLVQIGDNNVRNNEFQVYSQWGEDGIIQYLISKIIIEHPIFIEFGVENYMESNTRFLLMNNNWAGLIFDGSEANINYIKKDPIYWRHNLKAEHAFIKSNNINGLIEKNGIKGDIGLLSIDIDGNDYWIWENISVINPRIVICEYNSIFGNEKNVTIPYDSNFYRANSHHSNLYYGASIKAFTSLAKLKGYSLIGSNSSGNNVFFVRNDCMQNLTPVMPREAYVESQFRESRNQDGDLTFLSYNQRLSEIAEMPLINLDDNKQYRVQELYEV